MVNDEDEESQLLVAFDQETKDVKRIRLILPAGLSVNDLQSTTVDTVEVSERGRRLQFRSSCTKKNDPVVLFGAFNRSMPSTGWA